MRDKINLTQHFNFILPDDCNELINLGEVDLSMQNTGATLLETKFYPDDNEPKILKCIREGVAEITGYPIENQEPIAFLKYTVGGVFDSHFDTFIKGRDYYEGAMNQGGHRVKTCLMYLNEDFEGGETEFPKIYYKVIPKTGLLAIWDNIDKDKNIIQESEHAGLTVTKGVKYVASIWIREREFKNSLIIL